MSSNMASSGVAPSTQTQIDTLNSLLRGELSAVETYEIALGRLEEASASRSTLQLCRDSHQRRADLVAMEVQRVGGEPSAKSGPWGALMKIVEMGAAAFGEKLAIAALEEGEDKGLRDYREATHGLTGPTRTLLVRDVLPLQELTHRKMSQLKESYS